VPARASFPPSQDFAVFIAQEERTEGAILGAAMIRNRHLVLLAAIFALCGGAPSPFAQMPPSERELRIYAGLHDAAARGDVAEIEKLVAEGEKPNLQDAHSRTPLHVAAYLRKHEAARALIRLGADPNALDAERFDIISIAAVNNDLAMLKIALDGGGNPRAITSVNDSTALIAAARRAHVGIVRALIAAKAPLNHVNSFGSTALLEAVVLGNGSGDYTAVVDALVKGNADVNIADREGTTALQHARRRGYSQIARILESAGGH
jgi:ankyrin repeat protein